MTEHMNTESSPRRAIRDLMQELPLNLPRSDGAPGDFIGDRPVNSFIHPAGLPINTSQVKVLQRPLEPEQYLSVEYSTALARHGMRQSAGRVANCYNNSVAESFFATLKRELVYQRRFETRDQARREIFAWIGRYNTQRLHSTLNNQTPTESEHNYNHNPA